MVDNTEALAGIPPVPANCFRVVIEGKEIGISSVTPPTLAKATRVEPDKITDTITLRRAVGQSRELFEWRRAVASGKNDRRDVTLELLQGPGGEALAVWRFIGCTPLRWQGPVLDALSQALAYEEIELAYKDLEWVGR